MAFKMKYKNLQGVVDELRNAVKAHGKQADTIEKHIDNMKNEHKKDFTNFSIEFDNYHSTHSKENKKLSTLIYKRLKANNHIHIHNIQQLFDTKTKLFLADRFIKGTCPKCKSNNQYGDHCEICSNTYNSKELLNPISIYSNSKPLLKSSEHYFFTLPEFTILSNV